MLDLFFINFLRNFSYGNRHTFNIKYTVQAAAESILLRLGFNELINKKRIHSKLSTTFNIDSLYPKGFIQRKYEIVPNPKLMISISGFYNSLRISRDISIIRPPQFLVSSETGIDVLNREVQFLKGF